MKNSRLTFSASTNFTLPIGAYQILKNDAHYYGYMKNGKPNINGFLNDLVPALSDYQDDLYKELLKYNNGNADMAKAVARSIHNIYLRPFTFHNDGTTNVSFRISQKSYDAFIAIHDRRLFFYDTDFTNYLRTLLVEYTSKTFTQRELLFAFSPLRVLKEAMSKNKLCELLLDGQYCTLVPVSIETSPVIGCNYIVGVSTDLQPIAVRIHDLKKATILDKKIKITDALCDKINDHLDRIYEEEYAECSD